MLTASVREDIRKSVEGDLSPYHLDLGMWVRNNWGLWMDGSRLKQYFDTTGVIDADDVSGLIVTSYWNYLNDRPIELPKRIVYSKIERKAISCLR